MMRQLLDVMDEAEALPLRIDLLLTPEREAIEPLVVPDVREHRFNRGKTLSVSPSAFLAVESLFHQVDIAHLRCVGFPAEEADLPDFRLRWRAQASGSLIAGHAVT